MLSVRETGFYVAAYQVSAIFLYMIDAFNRAYAPWLFSMLSSKKLEVQKKIIHGTYSYFGIIIFLAILFSGVMSHLIGPFLGEKYASAAQYIYLMSLACAFTGMYFMVTLYIQFAKRTGSLASITLSVGITNIISCYVFVEHWGGIGAAYSQVFAQFSMFLVSWIVAARVMPMPWFEWLSKFKEYRRWG